MRAHVSDLPQGAFGTATPMVGAVPAMLAEDPLFHELCDAFDELLSPMESALDCFAAYLDPWLAPPDYLDWLDAVIGAGSDPSWPQERRRAHLAAAVASHRLRGTAEGLRRAVAAAARVAVEDVVVDDPGGTTYATRARELTDAPPPGAVVVRVHMPAEPGEEAAVLAAVVHDAVEAARPVHCQVGIEWVES